MKITTFRRQTLQIFKTFTTTGFVILKIMNFHTTPSTTIRTTTDQINLNYEEQPNYASLIKEQLNEPLKHFSDFLTFIKIKFPFYKNKRYSFTHTSIMPCYKKIFAPRHIVFGRAMKTQTQFQRYSFFVQYILQRESHMRNMRIQNVISFVLRYTVFSIVCMKGTAQTKNYFLVF